MLDDPIVGRVEPSADDDQLDPIPRWNSHPRVRHQGHLEPMPFRDTVDLLLDRTAIGINIYVQQMQAFRVLSLTDEPRSGSILDECPNLNSPLVDHDVPHGVPLTVP